MIVAYNRVAKTRRMPGRATSGKETYNFKQNRPVILKLEPAARHRGLWSDFSEPLVLLCFPLFLRWDVSSFLNRTSIRHWTEPLISNPSGFEFSVDLCWRACCIVLCVSACAASESVLQCVAACCSVLQCVAVRCNVLQCEAVSRIILCVSNCAASESVLQCAAVCCSVL